MARVVEEISDILTDNAFKTLHVGQILMFNYEGSRNDYKITRINRKAKRCWATKVTTYHPDEIGVQDKTGVTSLTDNLEQTNDKTDRSN